MKKSHIALLSVFGLAAAVFGVLPQVAQRQETAAAAEALRLLQGTPPKGDSAGADAVWLVEYDIPDAAERRQIMTKLGNRLPKEDELPADLQRRRLAEVEKNELRCTGTDSNQSAGCLSTVRAHREAFQAGVKKHAVLLSNLDRLADYPDLDFAVDKGLSAILPPMLSVIAAQTAPAALDWVNGKREAALNRVCRNIRTGRKLLRVGNTMLTPMLGAAAIRKNTQLAAEMLAEEPSWVGRLPESCADAFAPFPAGEPNVCAAQQGEYRNIAHEINVLAKAGALLDTVGLEGEEPPVVRQSKLFSVLAYSEPHTNALVAQSMAQACTPETLRAIAADTKLPPQPKVDERWKRPACWHNLAGCQLAAIAAPDNNAYSARLQDMLMQQRAFQAALALYRLPEKERRTRLAEILAAHASTARKLKYDETAREIAFEPYEHSTRPVGIAVKL
ncbi:hypothetical protein [Kingella denitrificans]|uniref:hypothetical protein n=1 Tax=Kingella denitrificans TaxID=502 RepID=UPI0028D20CCC|nr:hypothetical protein [Kingella denitrificans]